MFNEQTPANNYVREENQHALERVYRQEQQQRLHIEDNTANTPTSPYKFETNHTPNFWLNTLLIKDHLI